MMIITRVVTIISCIVTMFCFDKSKEIVGIIAMALLVIALSCNCANE